MFKIALLVITAIVSFSAVAEEKIVWNKTPITIILSPNSERVVSFTSNRVRVKVPSEIQGKLSTLSNNGSVYWLADEEFESQQVLVQDKNTQQIIVINLSASKQAGSSEPLLILNGEQEPSNVGASNNGNAADIVVATPQYGYDKMTKVAALHVYAPSRLITLPAGMNRTKVKQRTDDFLVRHHRITMKPIISFHNAGLYVTAVKLKNNEGFKVTLDPRDIRGDWLAATFQHVLLGRKGSTKDTTTVYLVSRRPFWEAYK